MKLASPCIAHKEVISSLFPCRAITSISSYFLINLLSERRLCIPQRKKKHTAVSKESCLFACSGLLRQIASPQLLCRTPCKISTLLKCRILCGMTRILCSAYLHQHEIRRVIVFSASTGASTPKYEMMFDCF